DRVFALLILAFVSHPVLSSVQSLQQSTPNSDTPSIRVPRRTRRATGSLSAVSLMSDTSQWRKPLCRRFRQMMRVTHKGKNPCFVVLHPALAKKFEDLKEFWSSCDCSLNGDFNFDINTNAPEIDCACT